MEVRVAEAGSEDHTEYQSAAEEENEDQLRQLVVIVVLLPSETVLIRFWGELFGAH